MSEWLQTEAGAQIATEIATSIEARRGELIALLTDLVAARSDNPPGDVTRSAAVLTAFLGRHGLACEIVARDPTKPNLVSTVSGRAPGRHLILNGHMDTIAAGDEAAWTVPILQLSCHDGRLHGLGTGNMKGGLAALALAFTWLAAHRNLWQGRVSFTAVADETVFGDAGAEHLLDQRPDLVGDAVICGEGPGAMQLAIAEKGLLWVEITARSEAGQGMLTTRGSSAIARLVRVLAELDGLNDRQIEPPSPLGLLRTAAGAHGLRLSVNVGRINGGHFVSQAASRASAEVDFRLPPGTTIDQVEHELKALLAAVPGTSFRRIKGWNPNWTDPGDPLVACVSAAATRVRGTPPAAVVRLPASDASRWRARGVAAVCYGPQPLLASGTDDYVLEQDLVDCAKVYALAACAALQSAASQQNTSEKV